MQGQEFTKDEGTHGMNETKGQKGDEGSFGGRSNRRGDQRGPSQKACSREIIRKADLRPHSE